MGWIKCLKVKYNKKGAATALNNIQQNLKSNKRRKEQRMYYCDLCNGWHLTSREDYSELEPELQEFKIDESLFKPFINE